jgi:hypothetical protein
MAGANANTQIANLNQENLESILAAIKALRERAADDERAVGEPARPDGPMRKFTNSAGFVEATPSRQTNVPRPRRSASTPSAGLAHDRVPRGSSSRRSDR